MNEKNSLMVAPAYQKEMVASEFLTQDLDEVSGGVR